MSQAFSLKANNKPMLFSWDLETEHKNVEKRVLNNSNYARRDLDKELSILKPIATDYIEIIQTKSINSEQLQRLSEAIIHGPGGVWEQATTKLERLAYHFIEAKEKIQELIINGNFKTIDRALLMLSDAFTESEQVEILEKALTSKSIKVRERAASVGYSLKNKDIVPVLLERRTTETNTAVKEALDFAIQKLNES